MDADCRWCCVGMSVRTVIEMFDERVEQSGQATALRVQQNDAWISISWREWHEAVARFATVLSDLGVEPGDRVLLISQNRPEWVIADLAIMRLGAVVVPIHPDTLPTHCVWKARDAGARWAVLEDPNQLRKFIHASDDDVDTSIERFIIFDEITTRVTSKQAKAAPTLASLELDDGQRERVELFERLNEKSTPENFVSPASVCAQDLATIVYTSGTTGTPVGVCLTHGNLAAEARGNAHALPLRADDRQILILPLSQVFARAIYLTSILVGCEMSFSRGMSHLAKEFRAERPTFFVGVPAIFEALAARTFTERVGSRVFNPERVHVFAKLAQKRSRAMQSRAELSLIDRALLAVGDRTLFREIRGSLGGRVRFVISGGAPVSSFLHDAFRGMGVPIYEGYGLTETSGAVAVNTPNAWRTGTVGRPIKDVEVRIAEDGEVLIRGPVVSPGYWRNDEATRDACDEGWLRTGDIGAMVDGYLMITDRRCHMMVLRDGKSVSPQRIETRLQAIPVVKRAVVSSNAEDQLVALLTLELKALRAWAASQGMNEEDDELLCMKEEVYEELWRHVDRVNAGLRASEQIVGFGIIPRNFSTGTGELTTTNRIRRHFVLEKYRRVLNGIRARA